MKIWIKSGMYAGLGIFPAGYGMIGSGGEQIGIVYSRWGDIRFSFTGDNQVTVITPAFSRGFSHE